MELIEIKGLFQMDTGAPCPTIICNDVNLIVSFYVNEPGNVEYLVQRNEKYDVGIITVKFIKYSHFTFGMPNDENLNGHPYYKLGLQSYAFWELRKSDYIERLENIAMFHPRYDPARWKDRKHYILTFHDNMLECVAQSFEVTKDNVSLHQKSAEVLDGFFSKDF